MGQSYHLKGLLQKQRIRTKLIRMGLLFAKAVADESQLPPPEDEEIHAETYRTVRRGDRTIDLLPREYALLEYLMRHANQAVTRKMLLENVWDIHFDPRTSVVESHISRLRARLNLGFETDAIQTVRGIGYKLLAPN